MMTRARPIAIKRSRVQTRTSLRSELELCVSGVRGEAGFTTSLPQEHAEDEEEGSCTLNSASCFSLVLFIGRPRIYSMLVVACARFVLCFASCREPCRQWFAALE